MQQAWLNVLPDCLMDQSHSNSACLCRVALSLPAAVLEGLFPMHVHMQKNQRFKHAGSVCGGAPLAAEPRKKTCL